MVMSVEGEESSSPPPPTVVNDKEEDIAAEEMINSSDPTDAETPPDNNANDANDTVMEDVEKEKMPVEESANGEKEEETNNSIVNDDADTPPNTAQTPLSSNNDSNNSSSSDNNNIANTNSPDEPTESTIKSKKYSSSENGTNNDEIKSDANPETTSENNMTKDDDSAKDIEEESTNNIPSQTPLSTENNNKPKAQATEDIEIVDLAESDDDNNEQPTNSTNNSNSSSSTVALTPTRRKRPIPSQYPESPPRDAYPTAAYPPTAQHPSSHSNPYPPRRQPPPHSVHSQYPSSSNSQYPPSTPPPQQQQQQPPPPPPPTTTMRQPVPTVHIPQPVQLPSRHIPTWKDLFPDNASSVSHNGPRAYKLSLISAHEFTITAIPHPNDPYHTPNLMGMRKHIKEITRKYGNGKKAIYDGEQERWSIPLSAYYAFVSFLSHENGAYVEPIPQGQLQVISVGKSVERPCPNVDELVSMGVPSVIASSLAPYQREGVDFALQRNGRCLIADEMGLGKTIQSIAIMACYSKEWPLLVVTPSSTRYHWEAECLQWLGDGIKDDKSDDNEEDNFVEEEGEDSESEAHYSVGSEQETEDEEETKVEDEDTDDEDFEPTPKRKKRKKRVTASVRKRSSRKRRRLPVEEKEGEEEEEENKEDEDDYDDKEGKDNNSESKSKDDDDDTESDKDDKTTKSNKKKKSDKTKKSRDESNKEKSKFSICANQINVVSSSREKILHNKDTKVVICSYGLIVSLIKYKIITPGLFQCVIVDESHMLKSKKSKRTIALLPILVMAKRVVMLSGTPALAKPLELYPQLSVLGNEWWNDEGAFVQKYGKDDSPQNLSELHALLTSTVMIRRTKDVVLKHLPKKIRESVNVNVRDEQMKDDIKDLLQNLKRGKGILGKFARLRDSRAQMTNGSGEDKPQETQSPVDENRQRRAILSQAFSLTGDSKIPAIVDMLKLWLQDTTSGKICIFAHHKSVLNGIIEHAGLSNKSGSKKKYIHIVGNTLPKTRQEEVIRFQTDPTVRVAILGITAAGVGLTLTAASTIWFAELFWTPAIMVQAEDRCHRIGQQTTVKCLYIIAKGTLDELLWMLIEKKFRDLGEFVEGKEKMNIVVHKSYDNEFDAIKPESIMDEDKDDDDDDDEETSETLDAVGQQQWAKIKAKSNDSDGLMDLASEDMIQHDIEELGKEEQVMAKTNENEDEVEVIETSENGTASAKATTKTRGKGSSEVSAICLSDDDEEESDENKDETQVVKIKTLSDFVKNWNMKMKTTCRIPPSLELPKLSVYSINYGEGPLGIHVTPFSGRVVINKISKVRGPRPCVGHILVGVNYQLIPLDAPYQRVIDYVLAARSNPPTVFAFAEDEEFTKFFLDKFMVEGDIPPPKNDRSSSSNDTVVSQSQVAATPSQDTTNQSVPSSTGGGSSNDAIEILDDD